MANALATRPDNALSPDSISIQKKTGAKAAASFKFGCTCPVTWIEKEFWGLRPFKTGRETEKAMAAMFLRAAFVPGCGARLRQLQRLFAGFPCKAQGHLKMAGVEDEQVAAGK